MTIEILNHTFVIPETKKPDADDLLITAPDIIDFLELNFLCRIDRVDMTEDFGDYYIVIYKNIPEELKLFEDEIVLAVKFLD